MQANKVSMTWLLINHNEINHCENQAMKVIDVIYEKQVTTFDFSGV